MFYEKQVDHHSPAEWVANNDSLALATKQVLSSSHNLRTQSQYLRNDSKNRILWKNQETNLALSERVLDIKLWHKTLEETLRTIEEEISALLETKTALESALMNKVPLLEATKMCLMLKDRRTNIDVVEDDQYCQMKKEIKLLENISQKLQQKSKSVWEHLCRLKHTRDHLKADIVDKLSAHNIETYQLDLHTKSAGITLKPFPVEVPVRITPEQWHEFSQSNKTSAEKEMESARYLCVDALAFIRDTENQTSTQREATAFAIRKRIHELKQTRDMLVVQEENLEREIARVRNEVQELEKSLQDTAGPMKVVQTRLENRKWRPQMELCGDTPQTSLHQEFMHLRDVQSALQQKLQEARSSLNRLQYQLHQVASDIELKESTLEIENQCSKTHSYPRLDPYLTQLSRISKDKPFLQTVMDDTPVSDAYSLLIAETENQVERHQEELLSENITSKTTTCTMTEPLREEELLVE